ncbi:hypothetical protein [Acidicapsa ligni]|uniref:hypothetical protein n=1 Tax=Acidicapsa ligni TaxID=542300 RepID=UPI0021E03600|nr:hypothetical protein [Acidicapsa ligni]
MKTTPKDAANASYCRSPSYGSPRQAPAHLSTQSQRAASSLEVPKPNTTQPQPSILRQKQAAAQPAYSIQVQILCPAFAFTFAAALAVALALAVAAAFAAAFLSVIPEGNLLLALAVAFVAAVAAALAVPSAIPKENLLPPLPLLPPNHSIHNPKANLPHHIHAILSSAMKILLGIVALILVTLTVIADYKWKQWIAARKRDRDNESIPKK